MILICSLVASACVDLREFSGTWHGGIIEEDSVRQGFARDVRAAPLELTNVSLSSLTGTLTTSDGKFSESPLVRITRAASDTLASLTFDGDPLRSYLLFSRLSSEPTGAPALVVLSLFADDDIELRVIRGNDLYGVFHLRRSEP